MQLSSLLSDEGPAKIDEKGKFRPFSFVRQNSGALSLLEYVFYSSTTEQTSLASLLIISCCDNTFVSCSSS